MCILTTALVQFPCFLGRRVYKRWIWRWHVLPLSLCHPTAPSALPSCPFPNAHVLSSPAGVGSLGFCQGGWRREVGRWGGGEVGRGADSVTFPAVLRPERSGQGRRQLPFRTESSSTHCCFPQMLKSGSIKGEPPSPLQAAPVVT